MWKKGLLSVAGLVAAFCAPVLFYKAPAIWKNLSRGGSQTAPDTPPPPTYANSQTPPTASGPVKTVDVTASRPIEPPTPPIVTVGSNTVAITPTQGFGDVFRFDVNPQWIAQRWPRVSTGTADLQLSGFRVPLVTGTSQNDLAGALTYYFNANYQVQRVTFNGTTGNYLPLVGFLQSQYHFVRRITGDPSIQLYESVKSDGKSSAGTARFHTAPTLKANDLRRRFEVELVIERPES